MRFKELMYSTPMNMSNTYRYQTVRLSNPESLSEHTMNVMIMGVIFLNDCIKKGISLDDTIIQRYLRRTFFHDMPETMMADIIRPVKYHNDQIHENIINLEKDVARSLCDQWFSESDWDEMINDKDRTDVGLLLRVFDMLDVARKALDEVILCHNMVALKIVYEVKYYLGLLSNQLSNGSVNYIDPQLLRHLQALVMDAHAETSNLLSKYKAIVQDFRIDKRTLVQ